MGEYMCAIYVSDSKFLIKSWRELIKFEITNVLASHGNLILSLS